MRIDLYFTPGQIDELQLRDKNVVVIDVLRAGTSIATALSNGAREIIPVETVEAAVKISGGLFGDVVLLGGERGGKIIEGFHLGNSPSEYLENVVKGMSIVFTTTNGALAMVKGRYAKQMTIAAFVNVGRVVDFIKNVGEDFVFICAGNQQRVGGFCLEDAVCAGMIIHRLKQTGSKVLELSDSAASALILHRSYGRNLSKMLEDSEDGKYLSQIGFGNDLKTCAAVDSVTVLPVLRGNVIRLGHDAMHNE